MSGNQATYEVQRLGTPDLAKEVPYPKESNMNAALTSRSLSDIAPEAQYQMLKLTDTYDFGNYSFGWVVRPREWKAELNNLFAALKDARQAGDTTEAEAIEALLLTFFSTIGQDKGLLRRTCSNLGFGYKEASL